MDILKKMFQNDNENGSSSNNSNNKDNLSSASAAAKDEFRKPQWFEENESDDELFDDNRKFAFQVFTNPMELQKHFERQVQQIIEALNDYEDGSLTVDKNLKEDFLKPGFESNIFKELEKSTKTYLDTDLDGEIYPDQLHSLIQTLHPVPKTESTEDLPKILPGNERTLKKFLPKKKVLTDEQKIMGKIHGTLLDDDELNVRRRMKARSDTMTPMTPMMPRGGVTPFSGGVFEGGYTGPKMFSQSIISKTIRKPDGSFETTKITQDSSGNKITTVTRNLNGKTETFTTYDGQQNQHQNQIQGPGQGQGLGHGPGHGQAFGLNRHEANKMASDVHNYSDRNVFVSKEGYALPRNLW